MERVPRPDVDRLIESYRSYSHAIAAEVARRLPSQLDRQDLESAAELGLVEAAQAFDPSRGVQFKTFAYYRIRGAVFDCLRKMGWFSKAQYQQYRFEMAANEYMKDFSESPPPAEGAVESEYHELKNFTGTVLSCYLLSLEDLAEELKEDREKPIDQRLMEDQQQQRLRQAIAKLPEKNRKVIESYYFGQKSLDEIGQMLGMSKSWISRVHAKSLEMLRDLLSELDRKTSVGRKLFAS